MTYRTDNQVIGEPRTLGRIVQPIATTAGLFANYAAAPLSQLSPCL